MCFGVSWPNGYYDPYWGSTEFRAVADGFSWPQIAAQSGYGYNWGGYPYFNSITGGSSFWLGGSYGGSCWSTPYNTYCNWNGPLGGMCYMGIRIPYIDPNMFTSFQFYPSPSGNGAGGYVEDSTPARRKKAYEPEEEGGKGTKDAEETKEVGNKEDTLKKVSEKDKVANKIDVKNLKPADKKRLEDLGYKDDIDYLTKNIDNGHFYCLTILKNNMAKKDFAAWYWKRGLKNVDPNSEYIKFADISSDEKAELNNSSTRIDRICKIINEFIESRIDKLNNELKSKEYSYGDIDDLWEKGLAVKNPPKKSEFAKWYAETVKKSCLDKLGLTNTDFSGKSIGQVCKIIDTASKKKVA